MKRVEEIIVRKLIESDDFSFIYDAKHVHHGNDDKIDSFFDIILKECIEKVALDISGRYKLNFILLLILY